MSMEKPLRAATSTRLYLTKVPRQLLEQKLSRRSKTLLSRKSVMRAPRCSVSNPMDSKEIFYSKA